MIKKFLPRPCETFLLEAVFLRELIRELTPDRDEHMEFLTGPKLRNLRVVCRRSQPVRVERRSVVSVRSSAAGVADALIPIIEQGAELHILAHSHPGRGASATSPSGTDINCLGKIQQSGSNAIGLIVTRDGCVRFFSVLKPFRVLVTGTGITPLAPHVFQLHQDDSH